MVHGSVVHDTPKPPGQEKDFRDTLSTAPFDMVSSPGLQSGRQIPFTVVL